MNYKEQILHFFLSAKWYIITLFLFFVVLDALTTYIRSTQFGHIELNPMIVDVEIVSLLYLKLIIFMILIVLGMVYYNLKIEYGNKVYQFNYAYKALYLSIISISIFIVGNNIFLICRSWLS